MNTLETLQDLLIRNYSLSRAQLDPETPLTSLGVDSLGIIELMFHVEDQFGISLPDDKVPVLVTISDLVAYIDELLLRNPRPLPNSTPSIPG